MHAAFLKESRTRFWLAGWAPEVVKRNYLNTKPDLLNNSQNLRCSRRSQASSSTGRAFFSDRASIANRTRPPTRIEGLLPNKNLIVIVSTLT
jgi:hypothetical protein